ncbi:MAG: CPBP family intramembrane metalloprotease [Myxococcales bacterium]|jgi:membrane protease YdiL (CAAX protease family)
MPIIKPLLRRALLDSWRDADAQADTAVAEKLDWRPIVILVTTAVTLTLAEYFGGNATFSKLVPFDSKLYTRAEWDLLARAWWSGTRVVTYVVIPVLTIIAMPGERIRDYYLSFRGFRKHLWIYLVLYLLVLPAVLFVATQDQFLRTYPFYKYANQSWWHFARWEFLYATQFLALEFFFRGYMLQGLRHKFGYGAIFVMVVPYCMIHYPKPLPETLGAIVAGTVLGTLAMRTRSIWGGVLIHVGVALTMDWLALAQCPAAADGPCRSR